MVSLASIDEDIILIKALLPLRDGKTLIEDQFSIRNVSIYRELFSSKFLQSAKVKITDL